jgi:hypothetical protein
LWAGRLPFAAATVVQSSVANDSGRVDVRSRAQARVQPSACRPHGRPFLYIPPCGCRAQSIQAHDLHTCTTRPLMSQAHGLPHCALLSASPPVALREWFVRLIDLQLQRPHRLGDSHSGPQVSACRDEVQSAHVGCRDSQVGGSGAGIQCVPSTMPSTMPPTPPPPSFAPNNTTPPAVSTLSLPCAHYSPVR